MKVLHPSLFLSLLILRLSLSSINISQAEDWSQWLGNQRDGIWRETNIIQSFPADGLTPVWRTGIGGGYTSPAVANGRVFVMDRIKHDPELKKGKFLHPAQPPQNANFVRRLLPGAERVLCLAEDTGRILWSQEYACPYRSVAIYAIGPRATPTVDGNRVYTLGAEGDLFCLETETGQVVWHRNVRDAYQVETPEWGFAAHPLIDGDRIICMVGGKGATVVAFNKLTGKEIWRNGDAPQPGYCAPMIYQLGGKRQLVVWDSDQLRGLNPETGVDYWQVGIKPAFSMSIGAPQQEGNRLFVMGYSRVSAMVQVAADGNSATVIWRGDTKRGVGGVFNTAVIRDGHIYAGGQGGRYMCVRLEDGEQQWSTFEPSTGDRPASWANVFTVPNGDRYWLFNDLGEVTIAEMSPKEFHSISKTQLIEPTHRIGRRTVVWSHPALANRHIFIRNDKEILCYNVAVTK
ncbi:pyrrolo-quinoline quinone [Candidatus Poribacteria bacterium]|nr:pyrrolo-quinoline quinone [Candidatus Poribacteria bacterium]